MIGEKTAKNIMALKGVKVTETIEVTGDGYNNNATEGLILKLSNGLELTLWASSLEGDAPQSWYLSDPRRTTAGPLFWQ